MSNRSSSRPAKPAQMPPPANPSAPINEQDLVHSQLHIVKQLHETVPQASGLRTAMRSLAQSLAETWPADAVGVLGRQDDETFLFLRNAPPPPSNGQDGFQTFIADQFQSYYGHPLDAQNLQLERSESQTPKETGHEINSKISAPLFPGDDMIGLIAIGSFREDAFRAGFATLLQPIADIFSSLWMMRSKMFILANRDGLTGLFSRNYVMEQIQRHLKLSIRHDYPIALLMVDVDYFKDVNDRRGHLVGDETLKAVASMLTSSARSSDIVGRFGGDEFLVFLPHTAEEGAIALAGRLKSVMANKPPLPGGADASITLSIGIAVAGPGHRVANPEELLRCADHALLRAKKLGRNQFYVCHVEADPSTPEGSSIT